MKKEAGGRRGTNAAVTIDQNLPRLLCQNCHHALSVVGVEGDDKFSNDPSNSGLLDTSVQSSVLRSSRMDNSFVVLSKQKDQIVGVSPRHHKENIQSDATRTGKAIEDSFVVLPPSAASIYKSNSVSEQGGSISHPRGGNTSDALHVAGASFDSTITILKHAFEIATSQMQVKQPLCLECICVLSDKLEKEVEDVNRDIKAYETYLNSTEGEDHDVLGDADFQEEKLKLEEEERKLIASIEETEKRCTEINLELKELDSKAVHFKELEERYWHEFNDFQFQLTTHQEERDAILAKTEVSQAHLELLKRTNLLNDAFPIFHDGEFGTISNFRLGRLPKIAVEWDEINAAWGQACLLLHTMAQYFHPKFPFIEHFNLKPRKRMVTSKFGRRYRIKIIPMGSYPRILDHNGNLYELFGPVNLFWSTRYDRAMTLFLTCLKDFTNFAHNMDRVHNIPLEKCFRLPYKIENDRVENYTITQSFNKPENWTKALKYTLCNLKWSLYWFVGNTHFQPLSFRYGCPF